MNRNGNSNRKQGNWDNQEQETAWQGKWIFNFQTYYVSKSQRKQHVDLDYVQILK